MDQEKQSQQLMDMLDNLNNEEQIDTVGIPEEEIHEVHPLP